MNAGYKAFKAPEVVATIEYVDYNMRKVSIEIDAQKCTGLRTQIMKSAQLLDHAAHFCGSDVCTGNPSTWPKAISAERVCTMYESARHKPCCSEFPYQITFRDVDTVY